MSNINEIRDRLAEATSASKLALEIEEALAKELKAAIKAAASHLLPCPFCGGKAEFCYSMHDDGDRAPRDWRHVRVQCTSCEAAQEWTRYGSMEPRKEEPEAEAAAELDAATAWNTRIALPLHEGSGE